MIYVLAGTPRQFTAYCRRHDLHPFNQAVYVQDGNLDTLKGVRGGTLVITGTPNEAAIREALHYGKCFGFTINDQRG